MLTSGSIPAEMDLTASLTDALSSAAAGKADGRMRFRWN